MIDANLKEIDQLEKDLKRMYKRAIPYATRSALNTTAFDTRSAAQSLIGDKFVERNKWTRGSVRVEQARGLNMSRQESAVGSTEPYMERQEFGGTERAKGRRGVAIPTSYSAGQEGSKPRTRLPRGLNKLRRIKLSRTRPPRTGHRGQPLTPKQRTIIAIQRAVERKERYVFLDTLFGRRKQGIFKVLRGRPTKRGWPKGAQIKMVHDLSERAIVLSREPWLNPATDRGMRKMGPNYIKALEYQIERQRLFRKRS